MLEENSGSRVSLARPVVVVDVVVMVVVVEC